MLTVGLYYDVKPGQEAVFEGMVDRLIGALEQNEGHVKSMLYRAVKNPRSYAIISEWDSQEAFTTFIHSDAFKQATDFGKAEVLEQRPRHKVYGLERDMK